MVSLCRRGRFVKCCIVWVYCESVERSKPGTCGAERACECFHEYDRRQNRDKEAFAFKSKDEIVEAMYQFLRQQAKEKTNIKPMDYNTFFEGKTALDVLQSVVHGYIQMNQQEQMMNFYKVIYSERPIF